MFAQRKDWHGRHEFGRDDMKKQKPFIFVLLLIFCPLSATTQDRLWRNLVPGPYPIGYKVAFLYDHTRIYKSQYDYKGNLVNKDIFRPVQISIWYPALRSENAEYMKYIEYVITAATRFDYSLLKVSLEEEIINSWKSSYKQRGCEDAVIDNIVNIVLLRSTRAIKNAPPASGKYPLIVFCSGGGDVPSSHDIMFEYLAGHGYIIAAVSSNGFFEGGPSYNLIDEESQVRDMEFALNSMRDFPNVDMLNIGSMGFSYGGIVNVLFALRNYDIKAVLCLDGSICLANRDRAVKDLPYFRPDRLKIPFMNMLTVASNRYDLKFYEAMKYSDAYLVYFNNMRHLDFTSKRTIQDPRNLDSVMNRNITSIDLNLETACRYALNYLDAYMKNAEDAIAFLHHSPTMNDIPERTIRVESKKSFPVPPTGVHFIEMIHQEGTQKAMESFMKARENDPDIQVFPEDLMNTLGYEYLNRGDMESAVEIFQLTCLAYPNSSNSFDSLGEAYARMDEIDLALKNYRKAVELNPDNGNAKNWIRKLENRRKKQA
jgi:tetratricopeptide (TPR) repeat protein